MKETKRINTEKIFEGTRVVVEKVYYDDDFPKEHVIVKSASIILPITANGKVVLIKQIRTAIGDECLYEIPAGLIDVSDYDNLNDEKKAAKKAALRELEEETGYIANDAKFITMAYTSPGFTNEKIYIFYVEGLSMRSKQKLDESEYIEIFEVDYEEAMNMVRNNEIKNFHTIFALTWYDALKK